MASANIHHHHQIDSSDGVCGYGGPRWLKRPNLNFETRIIKLGEELKARKDRDFGGGFTIMVEQMQDVYLTDLTSQASSLLNKEHRTEW